MRPVFPTRLRSVAVPAVMIASLCGLAAVPPLLADSIGVSVVATSFYETNGVFPGSGSCNDPNYPNCTVTRRGQGLTTASALVSESGTTGPNTNPAGTTSGSFASVSATEGHIGLSFSADSEGIGYSEGYGNASWNDVMTIGSSSLAVGTPVTLVAQLGLDAEFVGLGYGSAQVQACFSESLGDFNICTSGSDSSTGPLTLPATVTKQFTAYIGTQVALTGSAGGYAFSSAWLPGDGTPSSWSMVATNSAHFIITPLDPNAGVVLTTTSGCSIANGYGCDTPPSDSTVPEPPSLALLGTGLLAATALFAFRWRRVERLQP